MTLTAEVFCLGNELLIGRTVNTNATFLSKQLTRLGFEVSRVTTVRDEYQAASKALSEILQRKPDVICISGGLGPTFDDIQLEVVAESMGVKIEVDLEALEMIRAKYDVMNDARRKMALLPQGSSPLHNSEGSAPGVYSKFKDTHLFSLPGVPREMKAIFKKEIIPIIKDQFNISKVLHEYGIDIRGARESDISHISDKVMTNYDDVSFKSHPKKDEQGFFLSLHTYAIVEDEERVITALEDWLQAIEEKYTISRETSIHKVLGD